MKKITDEQYEEKFLKERKDFITYSCENTGLLICDNRFKYSISQSLPIKLIASKKWEDTYKFLKENNLLKE